MWQDCLFLADIAVLILRVVVAVPFLLCGCAFRWVGICIIAGPTEATADWRKFTERPLKASR